MFITSGVVAMMIYTTPTHRRSAAECNLSSAGYIQVAKHKINHGDVGNGKSELFLA